MLTRLVSALSAVAMLSSAQAASLKTSCKTQKPMDRAEILEVRGCFEAMKIEPVLSWQEVNGVWDWVASPSGAQHDVLALPTYDMSQRVYFLPPAHHLGNPPKITYLQPESGSNDKVKSFAKGTYCVPLPGRNTLVAVRYAHGSYQMQKDSGEFRTGYVKADITEDDTLCDEENDGVKRPEMSGCDGIAAGESCFQQMASDCKDREFIRDAMTVASSHNLEEIRSKSKVAEPLSSLHLKAVEVALKQVCSMGEGKCTSAQKKEWTARFTDAYQYKRAEWRAKNIASRCGFELRDEPEYAVLKDAGHALKEEYAVAQCNARQKIKSTHPDVLKMYGGLPASCSKEGAIEWAGLAKKGNGAAGGSSPGKPGTVKPVN